MNPSPPSSYPADPETPALRSISVWDGLLALQETVDDLVHTDTVRIRARRLSVGSLSLACGLVALSVMAVFSVSAYPRVVEVTSLWVAGLMLLLAAIGLSISGLVCARRSLREANADVASQDLMGAFRLYEKLRDRADDSYWRDSTEVSEELRRIERILLRAAMSRPPDVADRLRHETALKP